MDEKICGREASSDDLKLIKRQGDIVNVFGERLKYMLSYREISYSQLAYKIGMNRNTIGSYIHKGTIPNAAAFVLICRALNVDHHYMLGEHNDPDRALLEYGRAERI